CSADLRRRFKRKNGGCWSAQFCTEVARPKRFELLTPRFVVWCSIQLSYGRLIPLPETGPRYSGIAIVLVIYLQGLPTPLARRTFARPRPAPRFRYECGMQAAPHLRSRRPAQTPVIRAPAEPRQSPALRSDSWDA